MRIEVIRCDECKKEHDAQYELPRSWFIVQQYTNFGIREEKHLCSIDCLIAWSKKQKGMMEDE